VELSLRSLKIGKVIVSIVWLFIVASVVTPSQVLFPGVLPSVFQGGAIFLVVSHSIEVVVFKKRMRGLGDYLLTMLFGLLQLKTIRLEKAFKQSPPILAG